jgi:hypothetical protein
MKVGLHFKSLLVGYWALLMWPVKQVRLQNEPATAIPKANELARAEALLHGLLLLLSLLLLLHRLLLQQHRMHAIKYNDLLST